MRPATPSRHAVIQYPGGADQAASSLCLIDASLLQAQTGSTSASCISGLNDVHKLTACQFARRSYNAICLSGSYDFVTSIAEIATRLERPLPGRDSHPLENFTLSLRTWATAINAEELLVHRIPYRWSVLYTKFTIRIIEL